MQKEGDGERWRRRRNRKGKEGKGEEYEEKGRKGALPYRGKGSRVKVTGRRGGK